MKHYDVIVVGAGNGGLTAALTMCKAGKKVLMLERHNIPGGCGTSFRRGRFEFEVALHQLYGIADVPNGDKGNLRKVFDELGVYEKINFITQKDRLTVAMNGAPDIVLPTEKEAFVKTLQALAPEDAEAIVEYQDLVDSISEEYARFYEIVSLDRPITEEDFPLTFKYGAVTGKEMLDKYFTSPLLKGIYQVLFGYIGLPIERIPFLLLCSLYQSGDIHYVEGGSMAMSNAIADEFINCGGTVRYNTVVSRILVENGEVKGVETEDGETYTADIIFSNAGRINTYVDLIDEGLVPEETYDDLRVTQPSQSMCGVFLGLDCTAEEAGIDRVTTFLLPAPGTPGRRYDNVLLDKEDVSRILMSVYSIEDPGSGPPDGCCLSIIGSKKLGEWAEMTPENYLVEKQKYGERMLEYFFSRFPKARGHVEEFEIFTPLTFMRYIGTQDGSIYGEDAHFKDLLAMKLDARSPLKGLYFCGASLVFGGFNTTLISGNAAAKLALADLEKGGNV